MRLSKTIAVEGGSVTVRELRVEDVRAILADFKRLEGIDIKALLLDRFDDAAGLLIPVLEFSDGASLAALSFSEVVALKDAVMEVNAAFLDLIGLDDLLQPKTPQAQSQDSTAVASPSSSEGMAA